MVFERRDNRRGFLFSRTGQLSLQNATGNTEGTNRISDRPCFTFPCREFPSSDGKSARGAAQIDGSFCQCPLEQKLLRIEIVTK